MASLNWTDGIGAASLSNAFIFPGNRLKNWTPAYKPFGERSQNLGTGQLNVTAFRDDLTVALEIPGIPNSDQPKMLRLQMHLKRGGSVVIDASPDVTIPILGTCKLAPGADVQIQLSDKTMLEYTFSTVLRGSPGFLSTPDGTTDFIIWLKADIPFWPSPALPADASLLEQQNDVTGNNNHGFAPPGVGSISSPRFDLVVQNGLPGVFFDSDNAGIGFQYVDRLVFPAGCLTGLPEGEAFIVPKLRDDPPLFNFWGHLWEMGAGNIGATQHHGYPIIDAPHAGKISDNFGLDHVIMSGDPKLIIPGFQFDVAHIYNAVSAPNYWINRMNGVDLMPPDLTTTPAWPDPLILNTQAALGVSEPGGFGSLMGWILEFVFVSPVRTPTQRAAWLSYLATKWAVTLP